MKKALGYNVICWSLVSLFYFGAHQPLETAILIVMLGGECAFMAKEKL